MSEAVKATHNQELEKHASRAFIVSRILLVLSAINAVFYAFVAINGQPLLFLLTVALLIYVGVLYYAGKWIQNGRVYFGAKAIIVGAFGVGIAAGLVIAGLGLVLAVAVVLVASLLAGIMLPQHETLRMIGISLIVGLGIIVADELLPYSRVKVPAAEAFVPILAVMMVGIFAIFIIRNFKEYSLRAKLIIATLALATSAILAVTVIVSVTTRNALTVELGKNLSSLAQTESLAIGEVINQQLSLLESVGLNQALVNAIVAKNNTYPEGEGVAQQRITELSQQWDAAGETGAIVLSVVNNSTSAQLKNFRDIFVDHETLLLTDQYGTVVASTEIPEEYFHGDEVWWQEAFAGGFGKAYISDPTIDEDGRVHVFIAVPIRDRDRLGRVNTVGVLLSEYKLDTVVEILERAATGETGFLELHFPNLQQELDIARGAGELAEFNLDFIEEDETAVLNELKASDDDFIEAEYEDVEGVISLARIASFDGIDAIENLGWELVVVQAQEEALAPVETQTRINLILGVVIIVIAGGLALLVSRILSRPILQLTDTAVAVAAGDYSARAVVDTGDEIGTLADAFNVMTEQLQHAIEGLEVRVEERTRALTASTEVSRSLSTILDPDQLVQEVVNQIKAAFNYYHVQIYLFDDHKENLVMMSGTGDAGQIMLARQHAIPVGKGLVGQAAAMNAPVLVSDVAQSEEWLPSKLLPDTKAEMTVPIASGDDVFGVLDVQHDVVNGLTNQDVQLLQAVANQVAVALQNARLYASTQEQAQQEAVVNAIGQQIQQANTMAKVLQIAAQELGRSLDVERVTVQIHRNKTSNGQS